MPRNRKLHEPGRPKPENPGDPLHGNGAPAADDDAAPVVHHAEESGMTPAQEEQHQRNMEAVRAQVGSSAALDWSSLNGPAAEEGPRADPDADLPDSSTINPRELKERVLTKQGWVVPVKE